MFIFLLETFALGLRNLRRHKMRSLLTALGIIIGVAAVITMVAIGEGSKKAALQQLEELGATNILVRSARPPESQDTSQATTRELRYGLTRTDLARLEALVPDVQRIVPLRLTEQKVVRKDVRANAEAIGTTPQAFEVINLELARGRQFTQVDYDRAAPVCVIGSAVAAQLFPYDDPLGRTIEVGAPSTGLVILEVIGVLYPSGLRGEGAAMINRDLDKDIYFPLSVARQIFSDTIVRRQSGSMERKVIEVSEIWLQASSMDKVEHVAANVQSRIAEMHPILDYEIKAPISILRSAERTQRIFNFVMGFIAGLSLLVGGIGIMNIMLASVTERTREIGIRRALGAKQRHITLQFLIETTVISLAGGLIGVGLGVVFAKVLPYVVRAFSTDEYPTSIAMWSVLLSFIISAMIGIVFGLYPAILAARMNPIEALRHE
ncbi:MAG: ABC transporter permease [Phycisphaerales bacterium]|nr:ABC transporter permease [Phycisphaerales bacterium]